MELAVNEVMGERRTPDERKAALARTVSQHLAGGWRVESQSDYQVVLAKGKRVGHGLHLFLSIITLGLWVLVWIALVLLHREQRKVLAVDEYGHVGVSGV